MIDCVQRHVYFYQRNARECILVYSSNNVQETVKKNPFVCLTPAALVIFDRHLINFANYN